MSVKKSKSIPGISPVMHELAGYIARAPAKALPAPVLECTKHHVLDTIAAMVSGSRLLPGKRAFAFVQILGGNKEATVVGTKFMTNAVNAALAAVTVVAPNAPGVIGISPVRWPDGIVIVAGSVRIAGSAAVTLTLTPPAVAGLARVICSAAALPVLMTSDGGSSSIGACPTPTRPCATT